MPRFFFNVMLNGNRTVDTVGMDLPELEAARQKAVQAAKDIMAERADGDKLDAAFLISDASGKPLLTVSFNEARGDRPRNAR